MELILLMYRCIVDRFYCIVYFFYFFKFELKVVYMYIYILIYKFLWFLFLYLFLVNWNLYFFCRYIFECIIYILKEMLNILFVIFLFVLDFFY